MKSHILIAMSIVFLFFSISDAAANEKPANVYENKIDEIISFYQGRLYLIESEFTILSDIGKDARKRIDFLQSRKQFLISEMKAKNIKLTSSKIRTFVSSRMTRMNRGLAYTAP